MKRYRYNWLNCIRNYRFHSIFLKNLILILCSIILPLVCILTISYYAYMQIGRSEEKAYLEERLIQIQKDVEGVLSEIRNKAIMLANYNDVSVFFLSDDITKDEFYDAEKVLSIVSLYKISTDVVDDVYVYSPYAQVVFSIAGRYTYEGFEDKSVLNKWQNNGERYQFEYITRKLIRKNTNNICFFYTTKSAGDRKGVIIFTINPDKLGKKLAFSDDTSLLLVDDNQILYDSTGQCYGMQTEEANQLFKKKGRQIAVDNELEQFGLKMIMYINSQPLYEKLEGIRNFMLIFIGAMICISCAIVFYISLKIFDPIQEIMSLLESETMSYGGSFLKNQNEMSYIQDTVYATVSRNKAIEEELVERIKLLKKAQAVALQAQINPHFINNTLETINWMVIGGTENENDASEMINCLSQLLRISLEDTDTFITLKDEIKYVQKYLFIQQKRLGNSFSVNFSVPTELEDCKIIKMVLQPIVENAIKYGIKPCNNQGAIWIHACKINDRVKISVKDSGLGLTKEEAAEINHSIRKMVIKESNHLGLSNVNQRIILAFGEEYGVNINGSAGQGTEVVLEIPYQVFNGVKELD